mmetsp:Transcript_95398/g.307491  ORF Transcript_95398/g.307491 Transcript_95398/m.307491 type:complete len:255 (-) Transcript_95398:648-1412(-)
MHGTLLTMPGVPRAQIWAGSTKELEIVGVRNVMLSKDCHRWRFRRRSSLQTMPAGKMTCGMKEDSRTATHIGRLQTPTGSRKTSTSGTPERVVGAAGGIAIGIPPPVTNGSRPSTRVSRMIGRTRTSTQVGTSSTMSSTLTRNENVRGVVYGSTFEDEHDEGKVEAKTTVYETSGTYGDWVARQLETEMERTVGLLPGMAGNLVGLSFLGQRRHHNALRKADRQLGVGKERTLLWILVACSPQVRLEKGQECLE